MADLKNKGECQLAHSHSVYDTDAHFKIDAITRAVKNSSETKVMIVQHDHNSERFTFEIPRFIDGHDMSKCNVVQVHYINTDSTGKHNQYSGIYEVDDLQVSPDSDDVVICSWLISSNATQFVGKLAFVIRFVCSQDGKIDYAWNTATNSSVNISSGINNTDDIVEEYADILVEWENRISKLENGSGGTGLISVLESDPIEPKEGQMWILRTTTEELTTPVIELGEVGNNSIEIKLSNASFDGSGAVVTTYNIYVNSTLNRTVEIAAGGTCTIDGLASDTEYQISVRGVKGAVVSETSNVLTATTERAEGEIITILSAVVGASGNNLEVKNGGWSEGQRAVALYTAGNRACVNSVTDETVYPIPVPVDATSCTVVCPGLMFGYNGWNITDENKYSYDVDSGWKASGTTYTFEAGAAEYATIGFSKSNGSKITEEDLAAVTITFA